MTASVSEQALRQQRRRVIFLGDEVATDLFGKENPVGKTVLVSNAPYLVVGVMQHKVQMGTYGGPDANHATIPITTFRAQFGRERRGCVANTKASEQ